jgi:hypothetical protein
MRIRDGFIVRELAGEVIVVPIGERVIDFNGLITLNDTAHLLWKRLKEGASLDELADAVIKEFDTDHETAYRDTETFVTQLKEKGLLE